jgi:hypothetical protein
MPSRSHRVRLLYSVGVGIAALLLLGGLLGRPAPADAPPVSAEPDTVDVARVYGRIQFVEHFPDYKVQVVDHFPDLRVQRVEHFPDGPGKWQIVDHHPDYKIQFVDHFPDFSIQYVDHFPGVE